MKWVRCAWSEEAARGLAEAMGMDAAEIEADVRAGRAELWRIDDHGWVVTRMECSTSGRELVLVAGQGRGLHQVVSDAQRIARAAGAASIRIHSARRGMGRMLARLGFEAVETVYRWRDGRK